MQYPTLNQNSVPERRQCHVNNNNNNNEIGK